MSGRKIGVGFNRPRVLGRPKVDVLKRWAFYRRMARFSGKRVGRFQMQWEASAVEVSRVLWLDATRMK